MIKELLKMILAVIIFIGIFYLIGFTQFILEFIFADHMILLFLFLLFIMSLPIFRALKDGDI